MGKVVGERENQAENTEGLRSAAQSRLYTAKVSGIERTIERMGDLTKGRQREPL